MVIKHILYGGKLWQQENLANSQKTHLAKENLAILLPLNNIL